MMETKRLEKLYSELLKDGNFQKYEMLADNPNIFEILKTQTYEIRHSNFLAWLFDPNQNHNLGNRFLKLFLYDLAINEKSKDLSIVDLHRLNYADVVIKREWKNIDILIVFDSVVIAIENKIHHVESPDQLSKYKESLSNEFGTHPHLIPVYLTPFGDQASHKDYINYSYKDLIKYIHQLLTLNTAISQRTRIYLEDYLFNIKNNVMGEGKKNKLINQIYNEHSELFDFVINNKYSELQEVKEKVKKRIKEKNWIIGSESKPYLRFLTKRLKDNLPKGPASGWKHKEPFLFEIHFKENSNEIRVFCTIANGDFSDRKTFIKALDTVKNYSSERKGWINYEVRKLNFGDYSFSQEDIVEEILGYCDKMVSKVEPLLLNSLQK